MHVLNLNIMTRKADESFNEMAYKKTKIDMKHTHRISYRRLLDYRSH